MVHLVEINDAVGIASGKEHKSARVGAACVPLLAVLVCHSGIDAPVAAVARQREGALRCCGVDWVAASGRPVVDAVDVPAAIRAEGILCHAFHNLLFKCKDIGEIRAAHGRLRRAVSDALVRIRRDAAGGASVILFIEIGFRGSRAVDNIFAAVHKLLLRGNRRADGFNGRLVLLLHFIYFKHGEYATPGIVSRLAGVEGLGAVGADKAYEIFSGPPRPFVAVVILFYARTAYIRMHDGKLHGIAFATIVGWSRSPEIALALRRRWIGESQIVSACYALGHRLKQHCVGGCECRFATAAVVGGVIRGVHVAQCDAQRGSRPLQLRRRVHLVGEHVRLRRLPRQGIQESNKKK